MTVRVLAAMDLPEGTTQAISYTLDPETYFGSSGPATGWPARLASWQHQLQWVAEVIGAGLRAFAETFWLSWGAECVMLLLLAAALVGANAVSLLFLVLVIIGMAAGPADAAASRNTTGMPGVTEAASRHGSSGGLIRGNSGTGSEVKRVQAVRWWWWHLVLGVLVIVLVRVCCCCGQLLCLQQEKMCFAPSPICHTTSNSTSALFCMQRIVLVVFFMCACGS